MSDTQEQLIVCPECGVVPCTDEDGCCKLCGTDTEVMVPPREALVAWAKDYSETVPAIVAMTAMLEADAEVRKAAEALVDALAALRVLLRRNPNDKTDSLY